MSLFLVVIFAAGLIWWSFFHFKNKNQPLTFENNVEREVEEKKEEVVDNIKSEPIEISNSSEIKNEEPIKAEEETAGEKNIVTEANSKKADENDSKKSLKIKEDLVSWGFSATKERSIDTIILHSSYNILGGDEYHLDKIILEYKQYGVAPHYVIDRDGNILRLVKDRNVAYHAGESKVPDGRTGVNNFSIGIELINSEKDKFTSAQYEAVNELISYLKKEHKIKYVLGHDQIAPGRKTDPWNINWSKIDK